MFPWIKDFWVGFCGTSQVKVNNMSTAKNSTKSGCLRTRIFKVTVSSFSQTRFSIVMETKRRRPPAGATQRDEGKQSNTLATINPTTKRSAIDLRRPVWCCQNEQLVARRETRRRFAKEQTGDRNEETEPRSTATPRHSSELISSRSCPRNCCFWSCCCSLDWLQQQPRRWSLLRERLPLGESVRFFSSGRWYLLV